LNLKIEIPEGFLEEKTYHTQIDYTVSEEMKKIWAVELDLLQELIRVCEENGLTYYADSGTLLGAVRHGGFIPWDDDVDLFMMRKDFDRLNELGPTVFQPPYFWQSNDTERDSFLGGMGRLCNSETTSLWIEDRKYRYPFHRCIWIDIFPLDYVPADPEENRLFFEQLKRQLDRQIKYAKMTTRWRDMKKYRGWKRAKRLLAHMWYTKVCKREDNPEAVKYQRLRTRYQSCPTGRLAPLQSDMALKYRFMFDEDWFRTTVDLPFEYLTIKAPAGYEELLTAEFGDWRMPVIGSAWHNDVFFDPDRPYTEYQDTVWPETVPLWEH